MKDVRTEGEGGWRIFRLHMYSYDRLPEMRYKEEGGDLRMPLTWMVPYHFCYMHNIRPGRCQFLANIATSKGE